MQKICKEFSNRAGRRPYKYHRCGRKPWKVSKLVERFIVSKLKELRRQGVCTCTTLQKVVAREKGVQLERSTISKVLTRNGYRWLPRAQKRKYSPQVRAQRLAFAQQVVSLPARRLRERFFFAMDGCVLTVPPTNATDRENFCWSGETHMWRKPREACSPELAGAEAYSTQAPLAKALPLWGGLSAGGFSIVTFHQKKKLSAVEWAKLVDTGKLAQAIKSTHPVRAEGPWFVICDNESFLTAQASKSAHRKAGVRLWQVPAKSPDLNPIELFWSWLRRAFHTRDLKDFQAKRRPLWKSAYRRRLAGLCRSQKAKRVAMACARNLRKVCQAVIRKRGAAAGV